MSAVAVGDRVEVDVTIMGETFPVEAIVAQVDEVAEGTRVIVRPEGTHATAFARTEWRALA